MTSIQLTRMRDYSSVCAGAVLIPACSLGLVMRPEHELLVQRYPNIVPLFHATMAFREPEEQVVMIACDSHDGLLIDNVIVGIDDNPEEPLTNVYARMLGMAHRENVGMAAIPLYTAYGEKYDFLSRLSALKIALMMYDRVPQEEQSIRVILVVVEDDAASEERVATMLREIRQHRPVRDIPPLIR